MTDKTLHQTLIDLVAAINQFEASDWREYEMFYERMWQRIEEIDRDARPGLQTGRLVRWPVANSYAHYLILEIGQRTCKLLHVPLGDGWHSPVVLSDGTAWRQAVEEAIRWDDSLHSHLAQEQNMSRAASP